MKEFELFKFNSKEVVAIVGSGGKTTLLKRLTQELAKDSKVLMAASTKYRPPAVDKDMLVSRSVSEIMTNVDKYDVFAYSHMRDDNRFGGITSKEISIFNQYIDYIIMEADGSKMLPYKGWRDTEPVLVPGVTMTVGILPLIGYNTKLSKDQVFNYDIFIKDFDVDILDKEAIYRIVASDRGMFKNALGRKVLYITQWQHLEQSQIDELIIYLKSKVQGIEIIIGTFYQRGPRTRRKV